MGKKLKDELPLKLNTEVKTFADVVKTLVIDNADTIRTYASGHKRTIAKNKSRRSCEDIYLTAKSYFPDITFEQVKTCMQRLRDDTYGMHSNFCNTCGRSVYYTNRLVKDSVRDSINKSKIRLLKKEVTNKS